MYLKPTKVGLQFSAPRYYKTVSQQSCEMAKYCNDLVLTTYSNDQMPKNTAMIRWRKIQKLSGGEKYSNDQMAAKYSNDQAAKNIAMIRWRQKKNNDQVAKNLTKTRWRKIQQRSGGEKYNNDQVATEYSNAQVATKYCNDQVATKYSNDQMAKTMAMISWTQKNVAKKRTNASQFRFNGSYKHKRRIRLFFYD